MADLVYFNIDDGLGEGLVRGLRSGFLTADDYRRIANGENLEGTIRYYIRGSACY